MHKTATRRQHQPYPKMTGNSENRGTKGFQEDSVAISKKIAIYCKREPTGDKILKYLQLVSVLKKNGGSANRRRSPWTELRSSGALDALMEALKKNFVCEEMENLMSPNQAVKIDGAGKGLSAKVKTVEICNVGLSILGNAFALDYAVRSQAMKSGFISSLQQFIFNFTQDEYVTFKNAEIISRAVKCIANLSNDSQCRDSVVKTGVATSVFKVLELAEEKINPDPTKGNFCQTPQDPSECFVDKPEIRQLICSCVRAIRILTSDTAPVSCGRGHVIKFGGIVTMINTLSWNAKLLSDEDFVLDVIRALTFLSVRIKSAPINIVDTLVYDHEFCKLRSLVKIFENSKPDDKLYSPVINCLIKFTANKDICDCLGRLRIFCITFEKLSTVTEQHYDDLIKLLMALTKSASFNKSYLSSSPLIGSTLKILKSSRFKEYHSWVLFVYENLYDVSKLVNYGLVSHLCEILRQELEDCDYDHLRRKISSLDDGDCSVHKEIEGCPCPFVPRFRCGSPSYQKIQEEMKLKMNLEEDNGLTFGKRGEDSLSPLSSPTHSWSSGGSSPAYVTDASNASYSSFSEDEGCISPSSSSLSLVHKIRCESPLVQKRGDQSDSECMDSDNSLLAPLRKKVKLDVDLEKEGKSLENLKESVKRITGVLNILSKCTHAQPFPGDLLQIIPILLGILLRGKVSLMSQRKDYESAESDKELHDMSRRTFEVSYKIILKMCSEIKIFPEMIVSGMIPVLHRLQEPVKNFNRDSESEDQVVQQYCANIISEMVGLKSKTAGWREGFIMRAILVNDTHISSDKMDQMILNIPLLYQKHPQLLRKFEMEAKSWTKILEMLIKSDDSSFYRFEDCALALCSICNALGVKWEPCSNLPILYKLNSRARLNDLVEIKEMDSTETEVKSDEAVVEDETVTLVLDDGTHFVVKKDLLVQASPVFSAMFNGHFKEAGQQRVTLPKVSRTAVSSLIDQIFLQSDNTNHSEFVSDVKEYDLSTIFELISLADRFLLEDVSRRALNTILTHYICPFSAPLVYAESVKLANLQESCGYGKLPGDLDLSLFVLKYILTGTGIQMSERNAAIRKIFDSVVPDHVVQDLKTLIEIHMYKP